MNASEILACAAYYHAFGHWQAARDLETRIKKSFENPDYYFNPDKFARNLYPFFFRCNVIHNINNAYEHILRSIIYSEGKGRTKNERDGMGI